ncbi:MAG: ABC transporter permease [Deltaproteobacteria bacterium]|jgi:ribose/xylose/arabinose/galactoside ABC-type transport system permease subunit|nr:ribose ABC transporter permease [Deltaproteobacteria bacterium]MBT6728549.1 ABC transporter permease [Deltaproteobacteria bacterium]MBT7204988.1 ABC transporter permease [Deltaproteobacteria bacterium]
MSELSIGHADKKWIFQGIGLTIVVILLAIIFSFINPKFATTTNLLNILTQASYYIILAVGMTFVIAAAGIDLSVGSLLALITVVNFELIKGGLNPIVGVILMFLMGGILGAFTGYLITYINIPPFIATLGVMVSLRGLALVHSAGKMHYGLPESLTWFGQGEILGIPVPVLISLIFALFGAWLFNRTKFGLHVRSIGGNREAARLVGINVKMIEILVYCFMGLCVALGGLIMIARIDSTQATIGTSMEIHVIAAVIIGGTSLFGGKGTIFGTLLGAILLSMMTNALVIAGVDYFWQLFIMGIIVLIAVTINNFRDRKLSFNV